MFIAFIFITATTVSLILEGSYIGEEEVDIMNQLTGYNTLEVSGSGIFSIGKMGIGFLTHGLPKIITWDYGFLQGKWALLKWIVLYPISAGVVYAIGMAFVGVVQGIFARIR
jgi:hypothetical protein